MRVLWLVHHTTATTTRYPALPCRDRMETALPDRFKTVFIDPADPDHPRHQPDLEGKASRHTRTPNPCREQRVPLGRLRVLGGTHPWATRVDPSAATPKPVRNGTQTIPPEPPF